MTSNDDFDGAREGARPDPGPDHAYALSLIQVHEDKIRVLMGSRVRHYLQMSRSFLSGLTRSKHGPLQSFDDYMRLARNRARKMVDTRLGVITAPMGPAHPPVAFSKRAEALLAAVRQSPLHQFCTERQERLPHDGSTAPPAADFAQIMKSASRRALLRTRPSQPRNVLLTTSDALDDEDFRARVMNSRQHKALFEEQPLVSVIMPTHNRSSLLEVAIRSVLGQTYAHLELLIIDDHSTDATRQVCERYAAADKRVRYLENAGKGVSSARNTGIRHSGGGFIAYLDDDNSWGADYLEVMLTHIEMEASDFAYASMRLTDHNGVIRFRGRHFSHADLLVQNYIDMNVVVHRRDLIDRAGLFDESLERTVDWEFIIRATESGRVSWAEFIGVDYSDDATRTDRLTIAKRYAWRFHVMNRHWVDWKRPSRDDLVPVTILVNAHGDPDEVERTLAEILHNTPEGSFELVVIDNRLSDDDIPRLHLWNELIPELRVVHTPQHFGLALGYNVGVQFARGRVIVFAALGLRLQPNWLEPLVAALEDDAVGMVQPVVSNASGSVHSAGYRWKRFTEGGPELVRHVPSKAVLEARHITAASSECVAMRRADFVAVRGYEPLFGGDLLDIDLSFRIREKLNKSCVVAPSPSPRYEPRKRSSADQLPDAKVYFRRLWSERARSLAEADRLDGRGVPAGAHPGPSASTNGDPVARSEIREGQRLQFAVKICCPSESVKLQWGDYHFAVSLAKEIGKLGHDCRIDMAPDWYQDGRNEDVALVLRGLYRYKPAPSVVNLMWLISHPKRVQVDELSGFDHVFVASHLMAGQLAEGTGVPLSVLMQCTDPELFHPSPAPPAGERIVFVGNSRKVRRPVVIAASDEGLPAEIYGGGWEGLCRPEMVKAESVPNHEVGELYRQAGVVLNDHWEDMQLNGFVSNRLFDACACAAPVISDYVAGLDVFDGLVGVLQPGEPLTPLVRNTLEQAPALRERRLLLASKIAKQHSFAARAAEIVEKSRAFFPVKA